MTVPKNKGGRPPGTVEARATAEIGEQAHRYAVYSGVTMYDLEQFFEVGKRTVQRRVGNIAAAGDRRGHPIWKMKDVAGLFCKPVGRMEEFIRSAKASDMPPELQKEYWNGQIAKQKFHQLEGNLWGTERVMQVVAELVKLVRTSVLLLPDEMERQGGLSSDQRVLVEQSIDVMLQTLRRTVQEYFDRAPTDADMPGSAMLDPDVGDDILDGLDDDFDEDLADL